MAAPESPSQLERVLREAREALASTGRRWALVGGLAVSVRAEPRFTRDVDLAVSVAGDDDAERLVRELQGQGYQVVESVEQVATGRLATVRLQPPSVGGQGAVLDLLFASSGIEAEIVERASRVEVFPDLDLPVASLADLIAVKVLARDDRLRPQDAADLRALVDLASAADLAAARDALRLVTERGFDRGRELQSQLDRALHG